MNKNALVILGSLTVVIYGIILIYALNPSGVKTKKLSDRLLGKQYIRVSFDSMTPTINRRANVKIDAYHYMFNPLRRNELIAYSVQHFPSSPIIFVVSRIVGLEGDIVSIREGKLYVNQREVNQPYVNVGELRADHSLKMKAYTVPENTVLLISDNRKSYSRNTVEISRIIGKVVGIYNEPFFIDELAEPPQEDSVADTAPRQEETIAHATPHKKEEKVIHLYLKIPKSAGDNKSISLVEGIRKNAVVHTTPPKEESDNYHANKIPEPPVDIKSISPDGGVNRYSRPATVVQERDCTLTPDQVSLSTINLEQKVRANDLKRQELENSISQATLNRDKYKNQIQEKVQKLYPGENQKTVKNMMPSQALNEQIRIKYLQSKLREVKIKEEQYINIKQALDKSELCDVPVEIAGRAK